MAPKRSTVAATSRSTSAISRMLVGTARQRPPAALDLVARGLEVLGIAARDHHVGAQSREAERDRAAQPASAAGHQRDAVAIEIGREDRERIGVRGGHGRAVYRSRLGADAA